MSLHSIAWISLYLLFVGLSFRRSSWGIPLYMTVLYGAPASAWWADGLVSALGYRWHLMTALIFAVAVILDRRPDSQHDRKSIRPVLLLLLFYVVNASAVHFLFADDPEKSWFGLQLLWKEAFLLCLMLAAIKDKFDLDLLIYSIILGCAYTGYVCRFSEPRRVSGRAYRIARCLRARGSPL